MARQHKSGRGHEPRHIRLYHYITDCPAWHDLNAVARAIYCEMARRYAGAGSNNGRIPYSVREAAAELKISRATASRALATLTDHGFIVPTVKGAFSLKKRHATEWRLTEFPCDITHAFASKDFMRWAPSPGGSLATAPLGARFASPPALRVVHQEAHPPGKLVVSL
jgi:DNA-binding transcriptional MocR family regulator